MTSNRPDHRSAVRIVALFLGAFPAGQARSASDTPQAVYERNAGCAGMAAAAVAYAQMASSRSEKERADAQEILTLSREQAEKTGAAIGASPNQITERIERQKASSLDRLNKHDAGSEGRKKEETELGRTIVACALVTAIERKDKPKE